MRTVTVTQVCRGAGKHFGVEFFFVAPQARVERLQEAGQALINDAPEISCSTRSSDGTELAQAKHADNCIHGAFGIEQ
jgi:hypothetical protein